MPPKIKMMKKMCIPEGELRRQIPRIRTKITVGQETEIHNKAREFVRDLKYTYGPIEDEFGVVITPSGIGKPYTIKCAVDKVPEGLRDLVDFFKVSEGIPSEELSRIVIYVYPPPRNPSSHENEIEAAKMITRDRVIYFVNSDEYISYKMLDPTKIQKILGMNVPANAINEIPEHAVRGNGYHLSQTSAVSLSVCFNDARTFQASIPNGRGSMLKSYTKLPDRRYVIVVDYILTPEQFKKTMKETAGVIGQVADQEPNSAKGAMAKKALSAMESEIKGSTEESGIIKEGKGARTIKAPDDDSKESSDMATKFDELSDDIKPEMSLLEQLKASSGATLIDVSESAPPPPPPSDAPELVPLHEEDEDEVDDISDLL